MESFNFCESQLEKIISLSKFYNNILFIVNKRQVNVRRNFNIKKHLDIKVELIHSKIKSLQNKFSISPLYLDCSYFNRKDKEFLNFLQQVMKTKTGDVYNLNKAPHISTNQRKDNEPCLKINLESPFHFKLDPVSSLKGNEPALSLNKKRTHSVKKNLSEVFKRLNFTEEKIC